MLKRVPRNDGGQLTILVLGYVLIVALLGICGIDASAAFIDKRALSDAADNAAVAAAGGIKAGAIYRGETGCGQPLPLDATLAGQRATASVSGETDLAKAFTNVRIPDTSVKGSIATVALIARAELPFASIIKVVDPKVANGVLVYASAHAQSPTVCYVSPVTATNGRASEFSAGHPLAIGADQ